MRLPSRRIARDSGALRRSRKQSPEPVRPLTAVPRYAQRVITPARGLAVAAIAATITLGAAQFVDYRAVQVGAPGYRNLENLTPAPELDKRTPRSAHGDAVLAIAAAAALVIAVALTKNWRLSRVLIFLGAAVIAISLAVDAPQGLREGSVAVTFQGARATLLGGFWVQLFSGVTLMVVGPVLALQLRDERDARRSRSGRRRPRRARGAGSIPSTQGGRAEEPAT
jgi:hypothetical protein